MRMIILQCLLLLPSLVLALPGDKTEVEGFDIIVIAGQSNAVGYGCGPYTDVSKDNDGRIWEVDPDGNAIQAVEPLFYNSGHGNKVGFAMTFARLYAAQLAKPRKVILVPVAKGATSILQWDEKNQGVLPGFTDSTELWDNMMARMNNAITFRGTKNKVVALLWHQGENDYAYIKGATDPWVGMKPYMPSNQAYQTHLEAFFKRFRAEFDNRDSVPVIMGEIGTFWADLLDPDPGGKMLTSFNKTLDTVAKNGANIIMVPTKDLPNNSVMCDGSQDVDTAHFSASSQITMGRRYFAEYQKNQNLVASCAIKSAADVAILTVTSTRALCVTKCKDELVKHPKETCRWKGVLFDPAKEDATPAPTKKK